MASIALRFSASEPGLYTNVGKKVEDRIVVERCDQGAALFGPYVGLGPGEYLASVAFDGRAKLAGTALMDVVYGRGQTTLASAQLDLRKAASADARVQLGFSLAREAADIEVRLRCLKQVSATIVGLELTCSVTGNPGLSLASGLAGSDLAGRIERIERLCRGGATYVGNNRVLAKVVVGNEALAYLMPADDLLLMPWTVVHGVHEPQLTNYFVANIKQSDHCLDIGANYGYFACLMALLARQGRTIGVEPNQPLYELLRDNLYINSLQSCGEALYGAVSDHPGKLTLHRRLTRSGNTSIGRATDDFTRKLGEPAQESFVVDSLPIDALCDRLDGRLDMVKIDVEGAEPLALRGARRAVAANPQLRIVMEWSPGQIQYAGFDVREFLAELTAMGLQAAAIHESVIPRPIPMMDLLNHDYLCGVLLQRQ